MAKHDPVKELIHLLNAYADLQCCHHHKEHIVAKGTFQITLTVDQPVVPLAVVNAEDLGPAGGPPSVAGLEISGGTPPYNVVLDPSSGQMPDGLTLNPDGTFSGVATTPGQFNITVEVSDSLG